MLKVNLKIWKGFRVSMNKRLVYTVIFGDYDELREVRRKSEGVDYICVTDNESLKSNTWTVIYVDKASDNVSLNRRYKFFPYEFFEYEESIYIDGNIEIVGNVAKLFDECLNGFDIAIPRHPFRDCIYEEALACQRSGKVDDAVFGQLEKYRENGFPAHFGLFENNCIVRRHSSCEVRALMSEWWGEFESGVKRDQLSLAYLMWKMNVGCYEMKQGPRYSNVFFKLKFHKNEACLPLHSKIPLYISLNSQRAWVYRCLDKAIKHLKLTVRKFFSV